MPAPHPDAMPLDDNTSWDALIHLKVDNFHPMMFFVLKISFANNSLNTYIYNNP